VRSRLARLWAWAHTHQGRKLIRFTSVSAISTLTSLAVIAAVYLPRLISNEIAATLFGNIVATAPSYYLNRTWTWGKHGRSHLRREIIPFWSMSSLGISFSAFGGWYAGHLIHQHHLAHSLGTVILDGFNLLSFAIFWVLKLIVFNRIFHVDPLASMDEHLTVEETAQEPL
jgi:putative flippase GtrA